MTELSPPENNWRVEKNMRLFSQESYQFMPDVDELVGLLEEAYKAKGDQERRDRVSKWAHREYDADMITERYWAPVLTEMEHILSESGRLGGIDAYGGAFHIPAKDS